MLSVSYNYESVNTLIQSQQGYTLKRVRPRFIKKKKDVVSELTGFESNDNVNRLNHG